MEINDSVAGFIGNPITSGVAGLVVGSGLGYLAGSSSARTSRKSKARKSGHRIKHTSRGWKQDRARRSKQKWEVAYQKRKKKRSLSRGGTHSRRGLHYTKNGQPYIILKSGKARFVRRKK